LGSADPCRYSACHPLHPDATCIQACMSRCVCVCPCVCVCALVCVCQRETEREREREREMCSLSGWTESQSVEMGSGGQIGLMALSGSRVPTVYRRGSN